MSDELSWMDEATPDNPSSTEPPAKPAETGPTPAEMLDTSKPSHSPKSSKRASWSPVTVFLIGLALIGCAMVALIIRDAIHLEMQKSKMESMMKSQIRMFR